MNYFIRMHCVVHVSLIEYYWKSHFCHGPQTPLYGQNRRIRLTRASNTILLYRRTKRVPILRNLIETNIF